MNTQLYKQYVAIELQYKDLEERRELLRQQILAAMRKEKIDKDQTPYGTFSVATKASWIYSPTVEKLQEKVKLAQVREQKTGKADKVDTYYMRYTPVKED